MQILMHINVGHDAAGKRIVFQIVDYPVHLVHHAFLILVLDSELIAVCLADGAVLIRPFIPDVAVQVMNVVGLLLPYPEDFIRGTLECRPAQGQNGKLL